MIKKQIKLKNSMKDSDYTKLCNQIEKQGKFVACGNVEDKWILVDFDNEIDCLAWMCAMGFAKIKKEK